MRVLQFLMTSAQFPFVLVMQTSIINTHTHTHIHIYTQKSHHLPPSSCSMLSPPRVCVWVVRTSVSLLAHTYRRTQVAELRHWQYLYYSLVGPVRYVLRSCGTSLDGERRVLICDSAHSW